MVQKQREIFLYVLFGAMTTGVNFLFYVILTRGFVVLPMTSTIAAWFLSVLFAYITNKFFVFQCCHTKNIWLELFSFYAGRLFTGVLDVVMLYVLTQVSHMYDLYAKVTVNVIVIIINYIFGRYVFKKERKDNNEGCKKN